MKKIDTEKGKKEFQFPVFCDFFCRFARFKEPDYSGACRKDIALWCARFERYNNKNNLCLNRGKRGAAAGKKK